MTRYRFFGRVGSFVLTFALGAYVGIVQTKIMGDQKVIAQKQADIVQRQDEKMQKQVDIAQMQSQLLKGQLAAAEEANSLQKGIKAQDLATKQLSFDVQKSQQNAALLFASIGRNAFKIKKVTNTSFFWSLAMGGIIWLSIQLWQTNLSLTFFKSIALPVNF